MRLATVAIAYNEQRFIGKHLAHIPDWVDEKLVLVSARPWQGDYEVPDDTDIIAKESGATVLIYDWKNEQDQRNAGQEYLHDFDWIIVLDPDEFLDDASWDKLKDFLEETDAQAVIVEGQYTYWKDGYVADPPRDYQQLIAVRPDVRFVDKRVVDTGYVVTPVWLHHFSWARTDKEVWSKISHYAHATDFDVKDWYDNVWLKWRPGMTDVHPTSPDTLHKLIPANLPAEIERLRPWPRQ